MWASYAAVSTSISPPVEDGGGTGSLASRRPSIWNSIDKTSRKRGHVYVTNVYDLKARRLLWSGEGRAKETLEAFFAWFGQERTAQLEGVCCDMWLPYTDVVKEKAQQAIPVFHDSNQHNGVVYVQALR
ncbi:MAG: transposase [Actinomycetota bacterium]|nr:transposase [Actinomycetota bacterium]MCL6093008.1 transposase [Actinomycetota bacterium]MDA8167207.1 transposase [Actinomycetota bacterium]